MDAEHFDTLARALIDGRSRRGALASLVGGTLGLLGLTGTESKKKKKKKQRRPTTQVPISPPPPPPCANGIKDGSETDVDCGGACPRCADGRNCATTRDCASGYCNGGTCIACNTGSGCGFDGSAECFCQQPTGGGAKFCANTIPVSRGSSCTCAPDQICVQLDATFYCYQRCSGI